MKKIMSLVLVLVLAMSLLVMPVSATETNEKPDGLNSATFNDAYDYVYGEGIYEADEIPTGTDPNEFMKGVVTRGEYALYLARYAGVDLSAYANAEQPFPDVTVDMDKTYAAIAWGKEKGYIKGYVDGSYKPNKEVTREEICAMLGRYYDVIGWDTLVATDNITYFVDSEVYEGRYSEEYIVKCVKYGLIQGFGDGTFGAGATGTQRAHMAAILHRSSEPEAALNTTKFYFEIASGEGFVSARVNEAYVMTIEMAPELVNPKQVTLTAEMTNVASLGVAGETRKHTTTINTNIESDGEADLAVWLDNVVGFQGGTTINVDIAGKTCAYIVSAATADDKTGVVTIVFMPKDTEATRAAWKKLTSHVSTETQSADDSYVFIANGSYLQLGTEVLEFESPECGDLVLDNFSDMDALETEIRDLVTVTTAADAAVVAHVEADTQLAVGSSVATLNDACTITVEGLDATEMDGFLGDMRDSNSTYAMAKLLVSTVNALVGAVEGETINVTVSFG